MRTRHPIVSFVYYVVVIGLAMMLMNPICLGISFAGAFASSIALKGKYFIKYNLMYMIPVFILTAVINPLFSHEGMTILMYLPTGNPLTLESIYYGLASATMLVTIMCWFVSVNETMTTDKIICLFGKIVPTMSLVLSMSLRFVPRFISHIKQVNESRKCMGLMAEGNVLLRMKNAAEVLSITVTWALEDAVDTADSMKSRGYGLAKRTAYSKYRFNRNDEIMLGIVVVATVYILCGIISGKIYWQYYPNVCGNISGWYAISVYIVYGILCLGVIADRIIQKV